MAFASGAFSGAEVQTPNPGTYRRAWLKRLWPQMPDQPDGMTLPDGRHITSRPATWFIPRITDKDVMGNAHGAARVREAFNQLADMMNDILRQNQIVRNGTTWTLSPLSAITINPGPGIDVDTSDGTLVIMTDSTIPRLTTIGGAENVIFFPQVPSGGPVPSPLGSPVAGAYMWVSQTGVVTMRTYTGITTVVANIV